VSNAAATSPFELGKDETSLSLQVIPPSRLYLVANDHVSLANRLAGFAGLMAMHSSALLTEDLLMLTFIPIVNVTAARDSPEKKTASASSVEQAKVGEVLFCT
jgi:hypothetical protein